jgi:hypothetical protein
MPTARRDVVMIGALPVARLACKRRHDPARQRR